jgi:hypothetical protein
MNNLTIKTEFILIEILIFISSIETGIIFPFLISTDKTSLWLIIFSFVFLFLSIIFYFQFVVTYFFNKYFKIEPVVENTTKIN